MSLLLVALLVVVVVRWDATARARGPLIADGVEYLMMAKSLVAGDALAVKPVRSGFFGLLLALPLYVERALTGSTPEGPSSATLVPLLFFVLAVLGTYRLGRLLSGPWAGLAGAFLFAILPEVTYWSTDFLTDVPAAALLVWAAVFWVQGRAFRVGVMLGLAVLLRYQSLIPLGAFLLVPVARRRWRELGAMLLGLLPAIVALGLVDWVFWGRPFQSLLFIKRHIVTFVPAGLAKWLPASVPVPPSANEPPPPGVTTVPTPGTGWYLQRAPAFFLWTVLGGLLLALATLRRALSRAGVLVALWVSVLSLAVLSIQSYKETRYLCSIAPLAAAVAGVGVAGLGAGLRRLAPPRAAKWALPAVLVAVGAWHVRLAWDAQAGLRYRPFASVLDAVRAIPAAARPCSVAMPEPWILAGHYPVRRMEGWGWFSSEITSLHLSTARFFFRATREQQERFPGRHLIDDIDYFVIHPDLVQGEPGLMQWINEHAVYDGYWFEPSENLHATMRLRTVDAGPRFEPFWCMGDTLARDGEALARFGGAEALEGLAVELVDCDVVRLATAENAVRLDLRWRLPEVSAGAVLALLELRDGENRTLARLNEWLVPNAPRIRDERSGASLRTSYYETLMETPADANLNVSIVLVVLPKGAPRRDLRPTGAHAMPDGDVLLSVPIREPEPPSARISSSACPDE